MLSTTAPVVCINKPRVERTLRAVNAIHGKGIVVHIVWGVPFAGLNHTGQGVVVRQLQYGMDAQPFQTMTGGVKYLGKVRVLLA